MGIDPLDDRDLTLIVSSDRDLLMLMNLNGRERSLSAWKGLFDSVSPALELQQVYRPAQGELSLLEITLSERQ